MTNPYYNHTSGVPFSLNRGLSKQLREEFDDIASAFEALNATVGDGDGDFIISAVETFSPFAAQVVDSDGQILEAVGDDLKSYKSTPQGIWPTTDADMENPLGSGGWPSYVSIAQSYAGVVGDANLYRMPDDWESVLYIIPVYGQSLAGAANDNVSDTIFNPTATYPDQAFMPSVGNKPDMDDFDTLQPLYEYAGTGYDSNFETHLSTMINTLIVDLLAVTGAEPKFATFIASRGGRTWPQIGPGNEAWEALVKGIQGCCKAARTLGLRPVVPCVMYLQGETDRALGVPRQESARHRLNMVREVTKAVKLLTAQKDDPVFFLSQPNNSTAVDGVVVGHMLAPLDVEGMDNIRVLPPHYIYTMPVNVHPDSASYVTMGGHMARAIREEVFGPGQFSLKIVEAIWFSTTQIDLIYSLKTGPLVIDTSGAVVTPPTWTGSLYGFQFFDNSGATPTISSAAVVTDSNIETYLGQEDRIIRITLSGAPTGFQKRIHYATRCDSVGASSGRATGPRGCVRDSAANPIWASSQVIYV